MYRNGTTNYFSPFEVQTIRELNLGDYHQGGIVCYIYKPKDSLYVSWEQHGLIISKEDLGYAAWGVHGKPIAGGTAIALGHGKITRKKYSSNLVPFQALFSRPTPRVCASSIPVRHCFVTNM